ncbi:alpha-xenorhabdolysin family binary toxin subunit B [Moellerella wisconsensis]|uniref:alpha-xenorhabdolysin family binary toxin subunit B n=1 Tax=Moellerella wisconsensis TaxID=158849 RepID=UPI0030760EC5
MSENNFLPSTLEPIDIFNFRMSANSISQLIQHKSDYNPDIYQRLIRINHNSQRLNEHIRYSLPIVTANISKLTFNDTINIYQEIDEQLISNTNQQQLNELNNAKEQLKQGIHYDINELISIIKFIIKKQIEYNDNISGYQLTQDIEKINLRYQRKKNNLQELITEKQTQLKQAIEKIDVIIAAEEIIIRRKLKSLFEQSLPSSEKLSSLSIPSNEIEILKMTLSFLSEFIDVIDSGLEFSLLVNARIILAEKRITLILALQTLTYKLNSLTSKLALSDDINQINQKRKYIYQQSQNLCLIWQYYNDQLTIALHHAEFIPQLRLTLQKFSAFIDNLAYHYNRLLTD